MMKRIVVGLAASLLLAAPGFADVLKDYVDARPVIKKDMRVMIVLRNMAKEAGKENGVKFPSAEFNAHGAEFAGLAVQRLKTYCADRSLEVRTGLAETSCGTIDEIEE